MKKNLFIAAFAFFANLMCFAQEFPASSVWQGQLGPIRIILRVFPDSILGKQVAVFDSPDQNANNLAVSEFRVDSDSLIAYSKVIGGGFRGKFIKDKMEISGSWKQGNVNAPVTLIRITSLAAPVSRPQTPKPPFAYKTENVEYDNAAKTVHFGGTLTLPEKNTGPFPVVILISGSGQQDRDETIFNHKPFAVLADHLTRNGIAVLRVDDRGVGQTTGEVKNATSYDFAKDVQAGISYLKSRKDIDAKKIGLIGHSEGGIIAPLVANQSKDVAFIVSMAGVGVKGIDLIKKQSADLLKAGNLPEDQFEALNSLYSKMFILAKKEALTKSINFLPVFEKWRAEQPQALVDSLHLKDGEQGASQIENLGRRINLAWMRYLINYDPDLVLSRIKIPVLAINGSKDIQVSAKENLAGFERWLKKAGNKDFKIQELAGLNHLFQTAQTGYLNEYATIEETISPVALQAITNWIKGHLK